MDAFVKDGYFYICYNGRQALCMNMAALFAGYDPASTEADGGRILQEGERILFVPEGERMTLRAVCLIGCSAEENAER